VTPPSPSPVASRSSPLDNAAAASEEDEADDDDAAAATHTDDDGIPMLLEPPPAVPAVTRRAALTAGTLLGGSTPLLSISPVQLLWRALLGGAPLLGGAGPAAAKLELLIDGETVSAFEFPAGALTVKISPTPSQHAFSSRFLNLT